MFEQLQDQTHDKGYKSNIINEINKVRRKFKNTLSNSNDIDTRIYSQIRNELEDIDNKFSIILDVFYNSDLLFNDISWFDQVIEEIKILDNSFYHYLNLLLDTKGSQRKLFSFFKKKDSQNLFINFEQIKKVLDKIYLLVLESENSNIINLTEDNSSALIKTLKRQKNSLDKDLNEKNNKIIELEKYINSLDDIDKNKPAAALYSEINRDLLFLERKYRRFFIISILLTLFIAIGYKPGIGLADNFILGIRSLIPSSLLWYLPDFMNDIAYSPIDFKSLNLTSVQFILFKLAILIVGLTLTTYFLRLSNFYQLRQEQAKQTKLELEAYPEYVSGLDKDVANKIREELALKYFGQELDRTASEKMGSIVQEQLSVGTELIRASTELVRAKGETISNEGK
ncbi:hypothetical protein [Acinetobacter bereziniae]|uniref:hypothetical protein n=1 Tax=Acinetobacter bereziniae TaxID=106648 RepID=UPI002075B153|nr:hypothetical protein [Acinetobacter bereziniae]